MFVKYTVAKSTLTSALLPTLAAIPPQKITYTRSILAGAGATTSTTGASSSTTGGISTSDAFYRSICVELVMLLAVMLAC
jgi:hypothetical protein